VSNGASIEIGLTKHFSNLVYNAKREMLWFYGKRLGLEFWFSPKEFESMLFEGGNWISEINWILKSPKDRYKELKYFIDEMKQEIEDIAVIYNEENILYQNNMLNNKSLIENRLTKRNSILIETARREKLWFYGKLFGFEFWFSPKEFEVKLFEAKEWTEKVNWILKSPRERVRELKYFIEQMEKEIKNIKVIVETYALENIAI
jgi:hypothetical protein